MNKAFRTLISLEARMNKCIFEGTVVRIQEFDDCKMVTLKTTTSDKHSYPQIKVSGKFLKEEIEADCILKVECRYVTWSKDEGEYKKYGATFFPEKLERIRRKKKED